MLIVLLLLQLPDDVKQNIEDAGARYIPYVAKLPRDHWEYMLIQKQERWYGR